MATTRIYTCLYILILFTSLACRTYGQFDLGPHDEVGPHSSTSPDLLLSENIKEKEDRSKPDDQIPSIDFGTSHIEAPAPSFNEDDSININNDDKTQIIESLVNIDNSNLSIIDVDPIDDVNTVTVDQISKRLLRLPDTTLGVAEGRHSQRLNTAGWRPIFPSNSVNVFHSNRFSINKPSTTSKLQPSPVVNFPVSKQPITQYYVNEEIFSHGPLFDPSKIPDDKQFLPTKRPVIGANNRDPIDLEASKVIPDASKSTTTPSLSTVRTQGVKPKVVTVTPSEVQKLLQTETKVELIDDEVVADNPINFEPVEPLEEESITEIPIPEIEEDSVLSESELNESTTSLIDTDIEDTTIFDPDIPEYTLGSGDDFIFSTSSPHDLFSSSTENGKGIQDDLNITGEVSHNILLDDKSVMSLSALHVNSTATTLVSTVLNSLLTPIINSPASSTTRKALWMLLSQSDRPLVAFTQGVTPTPSQTLVISPTPYFSSNLITAVPSLTNIPELSTSLSPQDLISPIAPRNPLSTVSFDVSDNLLGLSTRDINLVRTTNQIMPIPVTKLFPQKVHLPSASSMFRIDNELDNKIFVTPKHRLRNNEVFPVSNEVPIQEFSNNEVSNENNLDLDDKIIPISSTFTTNNLPLSTSHLSPSASPSLLDNSFTPKDFSTKTLPVNPTKTLPLPASVISEMPDNSFILSNDIKELNILGSFFSTDVIPSNIIVNTVNTKIESTPSLPPTDTSILPLIITPNYPDLIINTTPKQQIPSSIPIENFDNEPDLKDDIPSELELNGPRTVNISISENNPSSIDTITLDPETTTPISKDISSDPPILISVPSTTPSPPSPEPIPEDDQTELPLVAEEEFGLTDVLDKTNSSSVPPIPEAEEPSSSNSSTQNPTTCFTPPATTQSTTSSTTTQPPTTTSTTTTSSPPTTTTSTTTTTTTTSTTSSTSATPPTTSSPTETTPMLTTSITFDNGTQLQQSLPYVRAVISYSQEEFCHHKDNFRNLLSQWITNHLQINNSVDPKDIEFFNHPNCSLEIPNLEAPSSHPEIDSSNASLENTEETSVYFYVKNQGKISEELTENFPLFPKELEISEDLHYLKSKIWTLELVKPERWISDGISEAASLDTSIIIIVVISVLVIIGLIVGFILWMFIRSKQAANNYYGRRCRPVSMDAYSMDSVSVYHSARHKNRKRASNKSIKSYFNQAFDDPNGPTRPLNFSKLTHYISDIDDVHKEFAVIPVNMPKYDELPPGAEEKNRYANVIPVPETRVLLKAQKDVPNCDYINANHVRGPRNDSKYYIATQAPMDDTVSDFWQMVWEQESKVIIMLTDFVERGIDKCADYLPPSETLDCHRVYGDFQVTLKSRDLRDKFMVSHVQLKNLENNLVREIAHMWFTGWPAAGVPNEEKSFISFILDVRRTRKMLRAKGPIVVHCSPGTGRTGTFIASDLGMRQFDDHRSVDIPKTVYAIRRDRAGAVQTKEQYAFIYRVVNLYASKLTTGNLDSL